MTTDIDEITQLLEAAGWKHTDMGRDGRTPLDAFYVADYAAIGLVLKNSVADVVASWSDCQQQLSDFRERGGPTKDLYLLFLVPEVDLALADGLQTVVGDTHVCRKLCIERRNRALRDVLMDTLFIAAPGTSDSLRETPPISENSQLRAELLDDLTRKSSAVVLENAMAGAYDNDTGTP